MDNLLDVVFTFVCPFEEYIFECQTYYKENWIKNYAITWIGKMRENKFTLITLKLVLKHPKKCSAVSSYQHIINISILLHLFCDGVAYHVPAVADKIFYQAQVFHYLPISRKRMRWWIPHRKTTSKLTMYSKFVVDHIVRKWVCKTFPIAKVPMNCRRVNSFGWMSSHFEYILL